LIALSLDRKIAKKMYCEQNYQWFILCSGKTASGYF
jgi:hypothetical protein